MDPSWMYVFCPPLAHFAHFLCGFFLLLQKCVTALEKTWHMEHFFCAQCGKQFGEEGFHEREGKPYCRDDYFDMFAPKCGACNKAIMENYISALNSQWHPDCFVCRVSYPFVLVCSQVRPKQGKKGPNFRSRGPRSQDWDSGCFLMTKKWFRVVILGSGRFLMTEKGLG